MIFSMQAYGCAAVLRRATLRVSRLFLLAFSLGIFSSIFSSIFISSAMASSDDAAWAEWLLRQVNAHSQVTAAKEGLASALQSAEAQSRPLYNPTLDSEFEQEGSESNYQVGISQSVDWWDKQAVRQLRADFSQIVARQRYHQQIQDNTASTLKALVEWHSAKQQADISLQQETQLDTLIKLVAQRQTAGDLGEIDAELAYLSLSQRLNESAKAQAQVKIVTENVAQLLPKLNAQYELVPEAFWQQNASLKSSGAEIEQLVDRHPQVAAAKAQWQVMQQAATLAGKQAKADPTFGVSAGQSNGESIVALSVSIPLFVRNDFDAQTRAAYSQALAAKADYATVRNQKLHRIKGTRAALDEYQKRYQRWLSVMKDRLERSELLLNKQWRSGDLSTTEFLQALQLRSEGLIAGIELRTSVHLAQIDWLAQTGQLIHGLNTLAIKE